MSACLTLPSTWATDVHTSGFLLESWRWSSGAHARAAGSALTEPSLQSLLSVLGEECVSLVCCVLLFCFVFCFLLFFVSGRAVQNTKVGYITNSGDCRVIDPQGNDDFLDRGLFFDLPGWMS